MLRIRAIHRGARRLYARAGGPAAGRWPGRGPGLIRHSYRKVFTTRHFELFAKLTVGAADSQHLWNSTPGPLYRYRPGPRTHDPATCRLNLRARPLPERLTTSRLSNVQRRRVGCGRLTDGLRAHRGLSLRRAPRRGPYVTHVPSTRWLNAPHKSRRACENVPARVCLSHLRRWLVIVVG